MLFQSVLSRRLAHVVLTVVAAASASTALRAQSVVLTFNTQTESSPGSGTRFISNCYTESGFVVTAVGIGCSGAASQNAFIAGGPNSPLFGGGLTPSLLLNSPDASLINFTRVGGGPFNAQSIALAPFDMASTSVLFTGTGLSGPSVTQTFMLSAAQVGFQTFTFNSGFSNLTALRLAATDQFGEPLVKFDNVALNVVPEPATVILTALGLCTLAGIARRRARV